MFKLKTYWVFFICIAVALSGCESLQRKFDRSKKKTEVPPEPVIQFTDYTGHMTPIERYRKHYILFDYWNDELIASFTGPSINEKRVKKASSGALSELEVMGSLLQEPVAGQLDKLIKRRIELDTQIQSGNVRSSHIARFRRVFEFQSRNMDREFSWQDIQDYVVSAEDLEKAPYDLDADTSR